MVSATATIINAAGKAVSDTSIKWLSSDNSVLTRKRSGAGARAQMGNAWVYATNGGSAGKTSLTVTDSIPVQIVVSPRNANASVGAHAQFSAAVSTASGRALPDHTIEWTSADTRYATVSTSGIVTATSPGIARIIGQADGIADTATMIVASEVMQPPTHVVGGTHEPSTMGTIRTGMVTIRARGSRQRVALSRRSHMTRMLEILLSWFRSTDLGRFLLVTAGPGHLYLPIPSTFRPVVSYYLSAQLKLSANWRNHQVSVIRSFRMFPDDGRGYNVGTILVGHDGNLRLMAYD